MQYHAKPNMYYLQYNTDQTAEDKYEITAIYHRMVLTWTDVSYYSSIYLNGTVGYAYAYSDSDIRWTVFMLNHHFHYSYYNTNFLSNTNVELSNGSANFTFEILVNGGQISFGITPDVQYCYGLYCDVIAMTHYDTPAVWLTPTSVGRGG